MVGVRRRRVVAREAARRGRAYVAARTRSGRCDRWPGLVWSTVMDDPRVRTFDVVLATVVAAALVVVMPVIENPDARSFDALAVVLVVVAGGVLALHRRDPLLGLPPPNPGFVLCTL